MMVNEKEVATLSELLEIKPYDDISIVDDIDCMDRSIPFIVEMFRGKIEGNNHTISNLVLSTEIWGDEQTIALFHYLSHSSVTNLHFKNIRLEIEKKGYTPRIAGLCYLCSASIMKNVSMEVMTSFNGEIPLIFEANSAETSELSMKCNGKLCNTIKYM